MMGFDQGGDSWCVRCEDCDRLYMPLSEGVATGLATEHTERTEHTNCHAMPVSDVLPLIGTFRRSLEGEVT